MIPKITNILYATGLGGGTPFVFRYALSLAQKYAAKIHIIHGHENLSPSVQGMANLYLGADTTQKTAAGIVAEIEQKIIDQLQGLCDKETASDPHGAERVASITISPLPPKQAILAEADKCKADLIIMGSHRKTVLSDALLGTTTLKVLHTATIPVLVVRIPPGYSEEGF